MQNLKSLTLANIAYIKLKTSVSFHPDWAFNNREERATVFYGIQIVVHCHIFETIKILKFQ